MHKTDSHPITGLFPLEASQDKQLSRVVGGDSFPPTPTDHGATP